MHYLFIYVICNVYGAGALSRHFDYWSQISLAWMSTFERQKPSKNLMSVWRPFPLPTQSSDNKLYTFLVFCQHLQFTFHYAQATTFRNNWFRIYWHHICSTTLSSHNQSFSYSLTTALSSFSIILFNRVAVLVYIDQDWTRLL